MAKRTGTINNIVAALAALVEKNVAPGVSETKIETKKGLKPEDRDRAAAKGIPVLHALAKGIPVAKGIPEKEEIGGTFARLAQELESGTVRSRLIAVHAISTRLADTLDNPKAIAEHRDAVAAQLPSILPCLMRMAQEEGAERVCLKLVLSCVANLSYVGLTAQIVELADRKVVAPRRRRHRVDGMIPSMLSRALKECDEDVSLRAYAIPAVYNFSSHPTVLAALAESDATPLLLKLSGQVDTTLAQYAGRTVDNLQKVRRGLAPHALMRRGKVPAPVGPSPPVEPVPAKRAGLWGRAAKLSSQRPAKRSGELSRRLMQDIDAMPSQEKPAALDDIVPGLLIAA